MHTKNFIERLSGENMYTNGILSAVSVSTRRRNLPKRKHLTFVLSRRTTATSSAPRWARLSPTSPMRLARLRHPLLLLSPQRTALTRRSPVRVRAA